MNCSDTAVTVHYFPKEDKTVLITFIEAPSELQCRWAFTTAADELFHVELLYEECRAVDTKRVSPLSSTSKMSQKILHYLYLTSTQICHSKLKISLHPHTQSCIGKTGPLWHQVGETAAQYGLWLVNEIEHFASSDPAALLCELWTVEPI